MSLVSIPTIVLPVANACQVVPVQKVLGFALVVDIYIAPTGNGHQVAKVVLVLVFAISSTLFSVMIPGTVELAKFSPSNITVSFTKVIFAIAPAVISPVARSTTAPDTTFLTGYSTPLSSIFTVLLAFEVGNLVLNLNPSTKVCSITISVVNFSYPETVVSLVVFIHQTPA